MGKAGKSAKGGASAKDERKAKKAELNRARERGKHRRQQRQQLDPSSIAAFSKMLNADGFELHEVDRDGNCFFRSVADQCENNQHNYDTFRQRVCEHIEAHEDELSCFMTFGESEEEEDTDFEAYVARMRSDGEWAGQVELIAAAQALRVHIVVHQLEYPSYRIECRTGSQAASGQAKGGSGLKELREIHVSYHDGEHYNSVHPIGGGGASRRPMGGKGSTNGNSNTSNGSNGSRSSSCMQSGDAFGALDVMSDGGEEENDSAAGDEGTRSVAEQQQQQQQQQQQPLDISSASMVTDDSAGGAAGGGSSSSKAGVGAHALSDAAIDKLSAELRGAFAAAPGAAAPGVITDVVDISKPDPPSEAKPSSNAAVPGSAVPRTGGGAEGKATRKEEKRARKEQRHKEALAAARLAAGGAAEEANAPEAAGSKNMITL